MAAPAVLDIGSTIDSSFNVVRRHPRATLLPVFVVTLVSQVLTYVLLAGMAFTLGGLPVFERLVLGVGQDPRAALEPPPPPPTDGSAGFRDGFEAGIAPLGIDGLPTGSELALLGVLFLLFLIVTAWLGAAAFAAVSLQVGELGAGREARGLGSAVRSAAVAGLRALPVWIVLYLALAIGGGGLLIAVVALASAVGGAGGVFIGLLLVVAVLVLLLYLAVRWSLFPAALAVEGGWFGAVGRSWRLSRGSVLRLAVVLLVAVVLLIALLFGVGIVQAIAQLAGSSNRAVAWVIGIVVVIPLQVASSLLAAVAVAAPLSVAFLQLRAAHEGGDLAAAAGAFAGATAGWGGSAGPQPAPDRFGWGADAGDAEGAWVSRHSGAPDPGPGRDVGPAAGAEPTSRGAQDPPDDDDGDRERFGP